MFIYFIVLYGVLMSKIFMVSLEKLKFLNKINYMDGVGLMVKSL